MSITSVMLHREQMRIGSHHLRQRGLSADRSHCGRSARCGAVQRDLPLTDAARERFGRRRNFLKAYLTEVGW